MTAFVRNAFPVYPKFRNRRGFRTSAVFFSGTAGDGDWFEDRKQWMPGFAGHPYVQRKIRQKRPPRGAEGHSKACFRVCLYHDQFLVIVSGLPESGQLCGTDIQAGLLTERSTSPAPSHFPYRRNSGLVRQLKQWYSQGTLLSQRRDRTGFAPVSLFTRTTSKIPGLRPSPDASDT